MGGLETFPVNPDGGPTSIFARVGISLISIDQACKNAESEIPDWDFDRLVEESREQWNDILERFQIEDEEADEDTLSLFYSSVRLPLGSHGRPRVLIPLECSCIAHI